MKKVLMSTMALLVLSMMVISSVKAITKDDYWDHVEFDVFDLPDKQWVSEEGILHIKDMHWSGSYEGTLGTGTFEVWFEHLRLDLATGEGAYSGTWLITIDTIDGQGTFAGTGRGKITGGTSSGTFVGTHGTDAFVGVKKMGSYVLWYVMDGWFTYAELDAWGTIIYP